MLNKKVQNRQLPVWIMAALSAPVAIYGGKASWVWTLIVGIICSLLCIAVLKLENVKYGKILRAAQIILLGVVGGRMSLEVSACWETEGMIMPLTLITLAVLSALGDAERNARVCSVLAWILGLLYIVCLAAGGKDIEMNWLLPTDCQEGMLVVVFLLPAVSVILPRETGKGRWGVLAVPLFAALIGIWCSGTLSPNVTKMVEIPFYEYSKSLSIFGVAERFEALVSVALTAGLFCTLSLLFNAAQHTITNGALISGIIAAVIMCLNVQINPWILSILALIGWIMLPFIKSEKINRKK